MSPETPHEDRFAARVAEFEAIAGSLYASAVQAGHTQVAENVKDLWQSLAQWTTNKGEVPPILVSAALSGGLIGGVQASATLEPVPPDIANKLQEAADSAVRYGTREDVKQALDWLAEHAEEAARIVLYIQTEDASWRRLLVDLVQTSKEQVDSLLNNVAEQVGEITVFLLCNPEIDEFIEVLKLLPLPH